MREGRKIEAHNQSSLSDGAQSILEEIDSMFDIPWPGLTQPPQRTQTGFREIDTNNDGVIDRAEYEAFQRRQMKHTLSGRRLSRELYQVAHRRSFLPRRVFCCLFRQLAWPDNLWLGAGAAEQ